MAVKEQIAGLLTWGTDGSAFGARTVVPASSTFISSISQGFWLVETGAAVAGLVVNFTPDAGVTTVTYIATNAKATIFSDGFSWFISNSGTPSTVTLTQIKAMF